MDEQQQYVPPPQQTYVPPQQPYPPQPAAANSGLSDTAASAIAYLTFIPGIIFLVIEPYNHKPLIRFHCFQSIGLGVVAFCLGFVNIIPILGQIVFLVGMLILFVLWVICVINAAQGKVFKVPVLGQFAIQQSGLTGY